MGSGGHSAGRRAGDGIVEVPLPSLALAGTGRGTRLLARMLALVALAVLLGIAFLPWQQSVQGTGRVIAFNPLDRRVSIEAPVNGRVKKLHVVENQRVRKGDLIVEIQDNDPNLIANLRSQHDAAISRRAAAQQRMDDLSSQIANQELAKPQAIDQAQQRINAEQYLFETNQLNFRRMQQLVTTGDVSQRDYELSKLAYDSSRANLAAAKANLERTAREFDAAISATKASRGTAEADRAAADREIAAIDIQISQSSQQVVEAPRDGIVMSVSATEGTFLKPGTAICLVIPESEDRFVEAWVDGMDMPLITPRHQGPDGKPVRGSPVRLQFDAWPAIQIVGWPSLAIGTFGGEVISIDAADDGRGRFRIIIAPEQAQGDGPWPGTQFLRQGVRANAWVLLRQVPLWFELWRQLNGFPPVVSDKLTDTKKKDEDE